MRKFLLTFVVLVAGAMSAWAQNVAQIGGASYATLAAAVDAAQNDETITMQQDVTLAGTVTVAGKNITLDLNGKTISGTCNASQASLVYIENNAGLTVKDGVGNGKLTYAKGSSNVGWTIDLKGALTLESGTIELTGSWSIGYAVDVRPNAWGTPYTNPTIFTMKGGQILSSDGAVRVASSSYEKYSDVSASFEMNGGYIEAAWDGVFIQQSDAIYDELSFTMNGGTVKSDLNPVRVYGPAATGYVNSQECMDIAFNGGKMEYTGKEVYTWIIEGVLRAGGGSSVETITESGSIVATGTFVKDNKVSLPAKVGDAYYLTLDDAATDGEDKEIEVELSGEHTLADDVSYEHTKTVTVNGNLTYTRNLTGNWNPIYFPFDYEFDTNVYTLAEFVDGEGATLTLQLVENGELKANTPYVVRPNDREPKELFVDLDGRTLVRAEVTERELGEYFVLLGNNKKVNGSALRSMLEKKYDDPKFQTPRVVGSKDGSWGILGNSTNLKPYRLILAGPATVENGQNAISMRILSGTTVVEEVVLDAQEAEAIFDLMGRRVETMTKGEIYIVNGKKVIF